MARRIITGLSNSPAVLMAKAIKARIVISLYGLIYESIRREIAVSNLFVTSSVSKNSAMAHFPPSTGLAETSASSS